jgi:hypothetical protein
MSSRPKSHAFRDSASPSGPPPNSQPVYVFNAGLLPLNIWVNANPISQQPTMSGLTATTASTGFNPVQASTTLLFVPQAGPVEGQFMFGNNSVYFQFEGNSISPAVNIPITFGMPPEPSALFVFYQSGPVSATTYLFTWGGIPQQGTVVPG